MTTHWQQGSKLLYRSPTPVTIDPEIEALKHQLGPDGELIFINSSNPNTDLPPPSSLHGLISTAASSFQHSDDFLSKALSLLKPNGRLILREPLLFNESDQNLASDFPVRSLKGLKHSLTIAGYINITDRQEGEPALIDLGDKGSFRIAMFEILANKPSWEIGSSASLSSLSSSQPLKRKPIASVWKLDEDDTIDEGIDKVNVWKMAMDDGNEELVDEDELLKEEDIEPLQKKSKKDDCEFGKDGVKKACKNCVCGRAEEERKEALEVLKEVVVEQVKQVNSSCGSCYLGDAFRCGGCPYRGLPPFKPGDKVTIKT